MLFVPCIVVLFHIVTRKCTVYWVLLSWSAGGTVHCT